jgi:hypothetical protein
MHRLIPVFLLLIAVTSAWAQTEESRRRLEEEKREDLRPTEAQYYETPSPEAPLESPEAFFVSLKEKKVATQADAAYVVSLLLKEESPVRDFKRHRQILLDHQILSEKKSSEFTEQKPLTHGMLAYLLYQALDIKGGINLKLFGPSQRYAYKELVYQRIMQDKNPREFMSGAELSYTFIKATQFLKRINKPK